MKNLLKEVKIGQLDERMNLYLLKANQFIEENFQDWNLEFDVDLEVTNHVLRCKASDQTVSCYQDTIMRLIECQNGNGGWGDMRDDSISKVRSSAFTIQMLLRSNRILKNPIVSKAINRGLDYLLSQQDSEGLWFDPTWHYLDAMSVSVGTLLFAVNETEWSTDIYKNSLRKAINHIRTQRDREGLWFYKKTGSPVTITAHLLPKCVTFEGVQPIDRLSVYSLIKLQNREGHWDDCNTDHTCDSVRAMMLTASRENSQALYNVVYESTCTAIVWLLDTSEEIGCGLGDKPGLPAHVERTCDGIDTLMKFQKFCSDAQNLISFWK